MDKIVVPVAFIGCLVYMIGLFYAMYRIEKQKLPPEEEGDIESQKEDIENQDKFIEE